MANRHLLHISKLEDFKNWLKNDGWTIEETKGFYEVLRARKDGRIHPLLIYRGKSNQHLGFNDKDAYVVRAFLGKQKTNADRIKAMSVEELAKFIMCPYETNGEVAPCEKSPEFVTIDRCYKCCLDWLKAEVKE